MFGGNIKKESELITRLPPGTLVVGLWGSSLCL